MTNWERHNYVIFGKLVIWLVGKLKILGKNLICSQYLDLQFFLNS